MISSRFTATVRSRSLRLATTVRDDLRRRRQVRAERRLLIRELASYTTPAQVEDLLGSMQGQDQAGVAEIRSIVVRNIHDDARLAGLAS